MSKNPHKIIPELVLNWELAGRMLTEFIRREVSRAGFNKVTLGLSGGIDSALSADLAVKALGKANVIALQMPYKSSNPESALHAEQMSDFLGIKLTTVEITGAVDELISERGVQDAIRQGNVMARIRMTALYDVAAEQGALVLGTGNKTEIMLGYSTLFGDAACSLNAIGDLYKTQVWAMSAAFDLPEAIIAKVPSADLWAGQTDEGELGISYEDADAILYHIIDRRFSIAETVKMGFEEKLVQMMSERVRKYHFKRVMPIVAKVSPRTVGSDFLYARDWGS